MKLMGRSRTPGLCAPTRSGRFCADCRSGESVPPRSRRKIEKREWEREAQTDLQLPEEGIMKSISLGAAGVVTALALIVPVTSANAATAPRDKVPACAHALGSVHSLRSDVRTWWPRLVRATPVSDPDLEFDPWAGAAAALAAFAGTPQRYTGKYLPQWTVEAADAVTVLGIKVGIYPEVPQAVHDGAVHDLKQAISHMHYWCTASVPAVLAVPK